MAKYDMKCNSCDTVVEVSCAIAERENQSCANCHGSLTPLFSPPTTVVIPNAFHYSFSDLYGTTSEKDFLRDNPDVERINQSTFVPAAERRKRKYEAAQKEAAEIEQAIIANRTLTGRGDKTGRKPVETEVGTMTPDVPHKKV